MLNNSSYFVINETSIQKDGVSSFDFVHNVVLVCLGILTIFANVPVLLIYVLAKPAIRKKTANVMLCNQAVVDLFHGTITNGITVFGKTQFLALHIIYQFSMALSLHTVVLVSVERYLFIIKPLYHRKTMTRARVCYAVVISWLSSALWIPFRLVHFIDQNVNWKEYTLYYIAISEAIVFLIIMAVIYSYVATYRTVKKFIHRKYQCIRDTRDESDLIGQERLKTIQSTKEFRITKIFISMFVAFLISYLPVFVTGLVHISVSSTAYTPLLRKIMSLDFTFYLFNCLFNPIVTLIFKEDFKMFFLKRFVKQLYYLFSPRQKKETVWKCELYELSRNMVCSKFLHRTKHRTKQGSLLQAEEDSCA